MPEDQRSPVLRSYVAQGRQYLVPALRGESRFLGVVIVPVDLRRVRRLLAEFPRLLGSLFPQGSQAGVHRDPVKPGTEGAFAPEVLYVCPDPDPDLLTRVLDIFGPEYAERDPVYQSGVLLDQFREGVDVAPGGTCDQSPILDAHRSTPPVETVRTRRGRTGHR